jgi:hypothetical protein
MYSLEQNIKVLFDKISAQKRDHDLLVAKDAFSTWFKDYKNGQGDLDKHLAGMLRHGLSEAEATLILSYTARTSRWTNQHSRNSLMPDMDSIRVEHNILLDKVLDKLPPFSLGKVFRMEIGCYFNEDKELYKWLETKKGDVFHVPYFLSTSKDKWDERGLIWEINTSDDSNARDISDLTQNPGEREVIFKRGSNFKIDRISKNTVFVSETKQNHHFPLIGVYHKNY